MIQAHIPIRYSHSVILQQFILELSRNPVLQGMCFPSFPGGPSKPMHDKSNSSCVKVWRWYSSIVQTPMLSLRRISVRTPVRVLARFNSGSGSSGAFRGEQQGDAFTKREKANEDYYIREHEKAALKKLRSEIEAREKDLESLKAQEREIQQKN